MIESSKVSPVPSKTSRLAEVEYRFDFAMREISQGKTMQRLIWNEEEYIRLRDGLLKLHATDGKWYNWALAEDDLTAEDYVVIEK